MASKSFSSVSKVDKKALRSGSIMLDEVRGSLGFGLQIDAFAAFLSFIIFCRRCRFL
uniref:Uncharacterized protein n=1 Tax=Schistosoma japonicum TaxID=6182 RepID=Q5C7F8_SCHJA|nr:unknown [Schistosoma japonicum]